MQNGSASRRAGLWASLEGVDAQVRLSTLLPVFWSLFWLLNGLDKLCNAPGFFGVTRDAAFVEYFARLHLPAGVALASLSLCGVSEVLLGLAFGAALALRRPVLVRLSLKGSALIFMIFSAADILFGDRKELWEHGTFLVLVLASMVALHAEAGPPRDRAEP
jgi:hypothetical protein